LENVASVWEDIEINNNDALTSLIGLDLIGVGAIENLSIYKNISLSVCEVQCICDYLASPTGDVSISDNASGCNSSEEVLDACEAVSVENINSENEIYVFPNPCTGTTCLRLTIDDQGLTILDLYEISGIRVKRLLNEEKMPGEYDLEIDVSDLSSGMYIIEVLSGEKRIKEKLMIK